MTPLASHTLLTTALVGALLPPDVPEGHMLRGWLDSWSGVGHVLDAMTAAGHHVELRQSVFGWRAEFYRESNAAPLADVGRCGDGPAPLASGTDGGAGRTEAGEPRGGGGWLRATRVGRVESPHLIPCRYSRQMCRTSRVAGEMSERQRPTSSPCPVRLIRPRRTSRGRRWPASPRAPRGRRSSSA